MNATRNKDMINPIGKEVTNRSKFLHGLRSNLKYNVFNWSFKVSLTLMLILCISNLIMCRSILTSDTVALFIKKHYFSMIEISIGAVGALISSLAIILVVFDKDQLSKIVKSDNHTFEAVVFPYKGSSTLWVITAFMGLLYSIFIQYLPTSHACLAVLGYYAYYYIFIFIFMYSILYMLYLISEILDYVLLSMLLRGHIHHHRCV